MISGIVTALLLVLFVAGWIWAWHPKRKPEFDAAAHQPLIDDDGDLHNADNAAMNAARETQP